MSNWKRRWRRRHKPFIVLAFVSLFNLLFPQHNAAAEAGTVAIQPQVNQELGRRNPEAPVMPEIQSRPAKRVVHVTATAYSSSRDETDSDPFTTASGEKVRDGVVASNALPFGTLVRFPDAYGNKVFTVLDRMGRGGKNHIDIWMPTKGQAKEWGVKYVKMEIL